MDVTDYMPMFLAEAREYLQQLNLAVIRLEENPGDRETVDEVFRIAHSLKGMTATMGFTAVAELTHVMEDVFELLRQRSAGLDQEAITSLLACLDALDAAIDAIEAGGREQLDTAPLIARLRSLIRERTPEQTLALSGGAVIPTPDLIEGIRSAGGRVLHVLTQLQRRVQMPAVRAHMVLAVLAEHGELIGSVPAPAMLERFDGHTIEAWVVTETPPEELEAAIGRISEVGVVTAAAVGAADPHERAPSERDAAAVSRPAASAEPPAAAAPKAGGSGVELTVAPTDTRVRRSVRVDADRLDTLLRLTGELATHRSAVEAQVPARRSAELERALHDLARSSEALRSMAVQLRMVPVEIVFMRLPRLARDLATRLGKQVDLELIGSDTELDRTIVDTLSDPLVHLIRNAIDHGIETPAERIAAGKTAAGHLTVSARQSGTSIVIEVCDDGRGIKPAAVLGAAVTRGLITRETAETVSEQELIELLFKPGFSTVDQANEISGRGVGLDAVRHDIHALGGEISLSSTPGHGTQIRALLPSAVAIVSALEVDVAGTPYAIPFGRIERVLRLAEHPLRHLGEGRALVLADGTVPLLEGRVVLRAGGDAQHQLAAVIRCGDRRLALAVDGIGERCELVCRPAPAPPDGLPIRGGSILADGRPVLIVDCELLAERLGMTRADARSAA